MPVNFAISQRVPVGLSAARFRVAGTVGQRHNRETAYSDKKQAQQKRNGEEAALVIDHIGRHIGTRDCRGSRERGQHKSNGGSQLGKGCFGAALVAEVERMARDHHLNYLKLESSVTAEPFYASLGYCVEAREEHHLTSGLAMRTIKMRKQLN